MCPLRATTNGLECAAIAQETVRICCHKMWGHRSTGFGTVEGLFEMLGSRFLGGLPGFVSPVAVLHNHEKDLKNIGGLDCIKVEPDTTTFKTWALTPARGYTQLHHRRPDRLEEGVCAPLDCRPPRRRPRIRSPYTRLPSRAAYAQRGIRL